MRFRIRPARVEDAEQVTQVHVAAWQAGYIGQIPEDYLAGLARDVERRTEAWRRRLLDESGASGEVLVAEDIGNEEVVGFTTVGAARDADLPVTTGELWAINLAPAAWGSGAASALFAAAVERLAETYDQAYLWVLETNERARRFYEKQGWAADGVTKTEKRPGFELHELRYTCTLRPARARERG